MKILLILLLIIFQFLIIQDYEIVHKKRPDGKLVRVKRRVIRVITIKKQPNKNDESDAPSVVEETPVEFEEVEVAENSPEFLDALDDPVSSH